MQVLAQQVWGSLSSCIANKLLGEADVEAHRPHLEQRVLRESVSIPCCAPPRFLLPGR